MNATNQLNIPVTARALAVVEKTTQDIRTSKQFIGDLSELFSLASMHADYGVDPLEFAEINASSGTGYYDQLMTTVFHDKDGSVVPNGSSISINDVNTKRRLYVIVLHAGVNIILHDRYQSNDGQGGVHHTTAIVATGGPATKLLRMNPVWSIGNRVDLINAAEIFGFEVDRINNKGVYVPFGKANNWFKEMGSFLNFQPLAPKAEERPSMFDGAYMFDSILASLKSNRNQYFDDHDRVPDFGTSETGRTAHAIAKLGKYVVLLDKNGAYSINNLYLQNGRVRLSKTSVGGTIDMRDGKTLAQAVQEYNDFDNVIPRAKITDLTYL